MKWLMKTWRRHGTKILGFSQVTIGAIALSADDLFGKHGAKYVLLVSGLLTAWRGFFNSQQRSDEDEYPNPRDA